MWTLYNGAMGCSRAGISPRLWPVPAEDGGWQWEEGVLWLPVSAVAYGAPFLRVVTQSPAVAANLTGIPAFFNHIPSNRF